MRVIAFSLLIAAFIFGGIGTYTFFAGRDPRLVKSTAHLSAGAAALREFESAKKEYESREEKYEFQRPDGSRLQSAIAYFKEASRICPPGTNGCYSYEIQRLLDYAVGLQSGLAGERSPVPKSEPADKEKTESRKKLDPGKKSARTKPISDSAGSKEEERPDEGGIDQPIPLKGSVRGRISEEPSEDDPFDNPFLGGGYSENVNKP